MVDGIKIIRRRAILADINLPDIDGLAVPLACDIATIRTVRLWLLPAIHKKITN
jgi:hypothetical protein